MIYILYNVRPKLNKFGYRPFSTLLQKIHSFNFLQTTLNISFTLNYYYGRIYCPTESERRKMKIGFNIKK